MNEWISFLSRSVGSKLKRKFKIKMDGRVSMYDDDFLHENRTGALLVRVDLRSAGDGSEVVLGVKAVAGDGDSVAGAGVGRR